MKRKLHIVLTFALSIFFCSFISLIAANSSLLSSNKSILNSNRSLNIFPNSNLLDNQDTILDNNDELLRSRKEDDLDQFIKSYSFAKTKDDLQSAIFIENYAVEIADFYFVKLGVERKAFEKGSLVWYFSNVQFRDGPRNIES